MNAHKWIVFPGLLAACLLLASCSPARATREVVQTVAVEAQRPAATEAPAEPPMPPPLEPPTPAGVQATTVAYPGPGEVAFNPVAHEAAGAERMIIKDAQVRLEVKDTDTAIDRLTQIVSDVGGYIISTRVWFEQTGDGGDKFATLTLGVPVDRFEETLRRLRELALRVVDENATGQDVTSEYVDLDSRLKNLEATRDRIRQFLDEATTVDQALKVNEQLSNVEGQIEQVKGRMNYLAGRSAFSTITVDLQPQVLEPTPTPTATPTPTPTPTAWNPGVTFRQASGTLGDVARVSAQAAIWLGVVVVPILILPALIVWLVWYLFRRRGKSRPKEAPAPTSPPSP